VPDVRGIDRTSRNIKRLRGVPDTFQVRKHFVEAQPDQPRNILSNDPSGPEFRHNSEHFRPEMAVILLASLLPGDTERLAGEPSANNVNWFEVVRSDFSHVSVSLDVGPMLFEDSVAEVIYLHLPFALHSGTFEAKVETTDTGEERTETHPITPPPARRARRGFP
jgi:hypothetical protein